MGAYKGSIGSSRQGWISIVLNGVEMNNSMHTPKWLVIGLLLVFLSLSVYARDAPSRSYTGLATVVPVEKSTVVVQTVAPLSVRPASGQTLLSISTAEKSTVSVLDRERASYLSIRARLNDAPASEQRSLREDLSLQRQAVLMAILNRVVVIYQRIDLIIQKSDASLTKLSALHDKNPRVDNFDGRMGGLRQRLNELNARSDKVADELESCPKAVDLSACVKSARDDTAALLSLLQEYLSLYRGLATQVLSR